MSISWFFPLVDSAQEAALEPRARTARTRERALHFMRSKVPSVDCSHLLLETAGSQCRLLEAVAVLAPGIGPAAAVLLRECPEAVLHFFLGDTLAIRSDGGPLLQSGSRQQSGATSGMEFFVSRIALMSIASFGSHATGVHVIRAIESAGNRGKGW